MTDDVHEFRVELRAWLEANAPKKGTADDFSSIHIVNAKTADEYRAREHRALEICRGWQRTLFDAGYAGRSWPVEYGGHGAPRWQDDAIEEEQSHFGVSTRVLAIALDMLPAVLFAHGTHEQRVTHLPRVVTGEECWCQLLSEPGAGSDLGSASTFATPVDGGWSVTGQKVWTSGAGSADFALLVARTAWTEPRRAGISCFILDMRATGVEVRPLRQMSGAYHFNEVFLDSVFVPEHFLIGGIGDGWSVLRTMLASERAAIGGGTSARSSVQLVALAQQLGRNQESSVRQLLAQSLTRERIMDLLRGRINTVPAGGSVSKLLYSEHARLNANAAATILGPTATVDDDPIAEPWLDRLLFAPGLRLGGGTDEIQRNTIAERGLGLPR